MTRIEAWPPLRNSPWNRIALGGLAVVLVADVVFAVFTLDRGSWAEVERVSTGYLALGLGLALVPWLTMALRIRIWSRFMGGNLRLTETLRITLAGDLGNAVAPTMAGGGAVKLVMLMARGFTAGRASALLLLTTVEDAVFFAVALPLGYVMSAGTAGPVVREALAEAVRRAAVVLTAAVILGVFSIWIWRAIRRGTGIAGRAPSLPGRSRIGAWWGDVRTVLSVVLRRGKLRALATLSLTALQWTCRYSVAAAVLAAFGLEVFPPLQLLLQWVVFTAGTIVPTPGGAAAVEAAFAVVYQPFVPESLLGTVTAAWRFLLFYVVIGLDCLVLGLLFLHQHQRVRTRWNLSPASTTAENEVSSASGT